jgi:hypothetical protein
MIPKEKGPPRCRAEKVWGSGMSKYRSERHCIASAERRKGPTTPVRMPLMRRALRGPKQRAAVASAPAPRIRDGARPALVGGLERPMSAPGRKGTSERRRRGTGLRLDNVASHPRLPPRLPGNAEKRYDSCQFQGSSGKSPVKFSQSGDQIQFRSGWAKVGVWLRDGAI